MRRCKVVVDGYIIIQWMDTIQYNTSWLTKNKLMIFLSNLGDKYLGHGFESVMWLALMWSQVNSQLNKQRIDRL
jgi:hypothetical protein